MQTRSYSYGIWTSLKKALQPLLQAKREARILTPTTYRILPERETELVSAEQMEQIPGFAPEVLF